MKLEIKDNGYDLVMQYKTERGKEIQIWHFDKNGIYQYKKSVIIEKSKDRRC